MAEEERPRTARRILVALESSEDSMAALEAAARLAAARRGELVGMFVEDAELLAAAGLVFTRTFTLSSRVWQELDPEAMRRAMAVRAEELRRTTEQAARRWGVPWSFRVVRGTARERLPQEAQGYELVVIGRTTRGPLGRRPLGGTARQTATRARCSVFVLRAPAVAAGRVVALYRGSRRALEAAEELACLFDRPLEVMVAAAEAAAAARLKSVAEAWLAERGAAGEVEVLEVTDAASLAAALERERGIVAVVDAAGGELAEADLQALLDRLDCPALVVR